MKTRRFKALTKGEHPELVEKIAIYDNFGKQIDCCIIHTDRDGREYYNPHNPHDKYGSFTDRPKDIIECIRNDFGDVFTVDTFFGCVTLNVKRYIDRELGEKLRRETLDGFCDATFGYAIKFSYVNSFGYGRIICKDKTVGIDSTDDNMLVFETEELANDFINEVNKTVRKYYDEYKKLQLNNTETDYSIRDEFIKKFHKEVGGKQSVYWRAFLSLESAEYTLTPVYKMKVIQVFIS